MENEIGQTHTHRTTEILHRRALSVNNSNNNNDNVIDLQNMYIYNYNYNHVSNCKLFVCYLRSLLMIINSSFCACDACVTEVHEPQLAKMPDLFCIMGLTHCLGVLLYSKAIVLYNVSCLYTFVLCFVFKSTSEFKYIKLC